MNAHAELCEAPTTKEVFDAARTNALNRLYELRYQTADLAVCLSRCHDLSAAIFAQLAHKEILASIAVMEKAHPELT